jgi:hypothetical protein
MERMTFSLVGCNLGGVQGRQEGLLFCEQKRSKKTLLIWARAGETAHAPGSESFLLLFYKKEAFPPLA